MSSRHDGNTRETPRRHHKAMHSGAHGKGHNAKVRAVKKGRGTASRPPAKRKTYLQPET